MGTRVQKLAMIAAILLAASGCQEFQHPTCTIDPTDFLLVGTGQERQALAEHLLQKGYSFRKDPASLRVSLDRKLQREEGATYSVEIDFQVRTLGAEVLARRLTGKASSVEEYRQFMNSTLAALIQELPVCSVLPDSSPGQIPGSGS